ncbi:hypothetical protein Agub_g6705, partial [Astrephomene gubernaculifera]
QVLPIPELVPFRLTPQLLGALQPHAGRQLLAPGLAAALGAACGARQLLGAILEVFLREPVADWQDEAMRLRGGQKHPQQPGGGCGGAGNGGDGNGGNGDGGGDSGAPEDAGLEEEGGDEGQALAAKLARSRVATALQKLSRRHPSLITLDELAARHAALPHFPALREVVRGSARGHGTYRGREELLQRDGPLSPAELAGCLLDQATDPNLLGRMYLGWRPYL